MVSNWLYGVAQNTALKAKSMKNKRQAKERAACATPQSEATEDLWRQVLLILDEELARLPDKYRVPIVLCDLEGKTIKETAQQLNWPQGTVATRLAQGRTILARRLSRHGRTLSSGALAALLSQGAGSAGVPAPLALSTIKAANLFAAGLVQAGAVSATVSALTEGVLKTMFLSNLKVLVPALAVAIVFAAGSEFLSLPAQSEKPATAKLPIPAKSLRDEPADKTQAAQAKQLESVRWNLINVDHRGGTIDVSDTPLPSQSAYLSKDLDITFPHGGLLTLTGLTVAKDVEVTLDGKAAKLKDLNVGLQAKLRFSEGQLAVSAIDATSRREGHVLKAVDAKQNTITVAIGKDGTLQDLSVAKDVYIYLYDKANEGKLVDLEGGMRMALKIEVENGKLVVKDIRARK
jgi:hypothetical protein